ncbi:sigma 54-interacting transcriptional regulator [Candidatus Sumerlaeota bacterium]|nr:sigma 54-interacting transcriptional regulator [Candidatus Sumerlaeota bacterium]
MASDSKSPLENPPEALSLLVEAARILAERVDLRDVATPLLAAVASHTAMRHSWMLLLQRRTRQVLTQAVYPASRRTASAVAQIEAGLRGLVDRFSDEVETLIVPKDSGRPRNLTRADLEEGFDRANAETICVPIRVGSVTIGGLGVDRVFDDPVAPVEDARLLSRLASMVAQAVVLRDSIREERFGAAEDSLAFEKGAGEEYRPPNLIGNSHELQAVFDLIGQVSKSDATVLIRGESGTGKELVAQAIHNHSLRSARPFIKVNCSALPETLIESELFGHEKGAFTGAVAVRKGRFELASGGTIFLDEIGYLSLATQVKLLRVLQEREFERVGGSQTLETNVRVIAATNRNLEDLMDEGKFLQDLYYRINVFPIYLPALRERRSDILLLANHFVEKYNKAYGKQIVRISTPAIDMMMSYHWPGNVRELENCIERAVLLSNDEVIHGPHLPPTLQTAEASGTLYVGSLQTSLDALERELIVEALKSARGNKAKAARALGISERLMGLRVKKIGIDPKRFRAKR